MTTRASNMSLNTSPSSAGGCSAAGTSVACSPGLASFLAAGGSPLSPSSMEVSCGQNQNTLSSACFGLRHVSSYDNVTCQYFNFGSFCSLSSLQHHLSDLHMQCLAAQTVHPGFEDWVSSTGQRRKERN